VTRARVALAAASILTAALLQATVIGPATVTWPVNLSAVLVAAVALCEGPAAGMSFGFTAGLFADLGSHHPAGVLALCWLGVGLVCGRISDRRSVRRDAVLSGVVCALAASASAILLALLHSTGAASTAVTGLLPCLLGDALLAFGVVPLVRRAARAESLRAAPPAYTDLGAELARRQTAGFGSRRD
jgi:cell shape-determining protein MreD